MCDILKELLKNSKVKIIKEKDGKHQIEISAYNIKDKILFDFAEILTSKK